MTSNLLCGWLFLDAHDFIAIVNSKLLAETTTDATIAVPTLLPLETTVMALAHLPLSSNS